MSELIAALLTPPGRTGLATIVLSGRGAWDVVARHFEARDGKPVQPIPGSSRLGRFGGEMRDDAVLVVTGDPPSRFELHVHGGEQVSAYLLEMLSSEGVSVVTWQEYMRLVATDAELMLTQAMTVRTASILLDQVRGAYDRAVAEIRALIVTDPASASAMARVDELLGRAEIGRHLTTPWRVVLAGAPNTGKSTLMNALAGYPRCIVSPTPGTTRDVVKLTLALDGWPITFADTAGLREGAGELEGLGIERAREEMARADLCVWLVDATAEPVWPEKMERTLVVVNKVDREAVWDVGGVADAVRVSAQTGEGMEELSRRVVQMLTGGGVPAGAGVPFMARHVTELSEVRDTQHPGLRSR